MRNIGQYLIPPTPFSCHLVLPGNIAGTEAVLTFLANEISTNTYTNLMDQYHPCYRAMDNPPLDRDLKENEYQEALELADRLGLKRAPYPPLVCLLVRHTIS